MKEEIKENLPRKSFVVKRSTWLRGEGKENSCLFRPEDGKKCCLGFACEQLLGLSEDEISEIRMPGDVFAVGGIKERELLGDAPWAFSLTNDNETISDEEREERLTKLFAKRNIDIIFED